MKTHKITYILLRSPKLAIMVAGIVLAYTLAWHFGIRKTKNLLFRYSEMERAQEIQKKQIESPINQLIHLEWLDRMMGCSSRTTDEIRQSILERVSQAGQSHPFSVVDIPGGYSYEQQGYNVMVNTFVVEGDYVSLLQLLYSMDTTRELGRVIASRMFIHRSFQGSSPELRMAIYFQNIQKENGKQ